MTSRRPFHEDPYDPYEFEDYVKRLLEKEYDCEVIKPPNNQKDYDLEMRTDGKCIAVQVKLFTKNVGIKYVRKITDFMELEIASNYFNEGLLISSTGFTSQAIANLKCESENEKAIVSLGTIYRDGIEWDHLNPKSSLLAPKKDSPSSIPEEQRRYFGIFTNKGGTGKTTVAAHLAGAFALTGYDVILLDLDPQKNLTKLFQNNFDINKGKGDPQLLVESPRPSHRRGRATELQKAKITVLTHEQWKEGNFNGASIVICDCNPVLDENPSDLIEKFNYCIIPTSLTPLGISKCSDVIIRTFSSVRNKNNKTEMFVLINCYYKEEKKRNDLLLKKLKEDIKNYLNEDEKSHLVNPDECAIHWSKSLLYWGLHVIEGKKPELAFQFYGRRSAPRTDFFILAEYLEEHDRVSLTKT